MQQIRDCWYAGICLVSSTELPHAWPKTASHEIAPDDVPILQQIARSRSLPWYQVQRARIVLAIAAGEPIQTTGLPTQCDESPSGGPAAATSDSGLPGLLDAPRRSGRPARISPLQRAQIVQLACLEPIAKGLHITHWTSEDLARQAVADGIVPAISARTVRRILHDVDLQPHRTRYWKTARLDARVQGAGREGPLVLRQRRAAGPARAIWVVCVDEMPNLQVLERRPIRRAIPGSIEQREFEYTRHGTVNILIFLIVHSGRMEAACLEAKDAEHYIAELEEFRRRHRHLRGVYLIHDGDPSHTAAATADYFAGCRGWWRPRFTPAHASWLEPGGVARSTPSATTT